MTKKMEIGDVSNDGVSDIAMLQPYIATISIIGEAHLIFHRWSCDAVEEKAKAAKGSKSKKTDNIESYVYRDENGHLALPGEYLRQSIIHAAKYKQDPRSPRKSAMDLFKAAIVCLTELSSFGVKDWDFLDRRRVVIQRNAITRIRPAMKEGWKAKFDLQVLLPEYVTPSLLSSALTDAGRLVGVGDFRPTFGRFRVEEFKIRDLVS